MEVRFDDGRVVHVSDDDPAVLAYLAAGKCERVNSADLPQSDPANVNSPVVEAAGADEAESPERPTGRGRRRAAERPETR